MEIKAEPSKELQYINQLMNHFSKSRTQRLKDKIFRKHENYSKFELTEILGNSGGDWAYKFLDKLEEEGIIEHAGKRETGSSPTDVYKYNGNKKLRELFHDMERFQRFRDLYLKTEHENGSKELI